MGNKKPEIQYSDLYGLREEKYNWLEKHNFKTTNWQILNPRSPYYFFVPRDEKGWEIYDLFWKITDIFPVNSVGVVTGRDDFVIDFVKQPLETRIRIFRDSPENNEFIKNAYKLKDKPASRWFVGKARDFLRKDEKWEDYFTKILYRPFDERWIFYHPVLVERMRENVMKNMLRQNLALMTMRQVALDLPYTHFLVTDTIAEARSFLSAKGVMLYFPLYLYYETEKQKSIFTGQEKLNLRGAQHSLRVKQEKKLNISSELLGLLKNNFSQMPEPEEIFYYIYAVLYSNIYRQKYQEFLKIDFPRVPITKDYKIFQRLAEIGEKLVDLHLLKSSVLQNPLAKFYGSGGGRVETRKYEVKSKRVYINANQYFEPVEKQVWEYMIGGYQVLDKWLKDRKGRVLSTDEIKHYCRIITTLLETIRIQKEIDKIYPEVEKSLMD